jgi:hypothetical protein
VTVDAVPVAERLLQTKFFGVPVRRLGQAVALPLSPALLASMLGLKIRFVGPLLLAGLTIGTVLFYRTPDGQSPFEWVRGGTRWLLGPDRSFWQPIHQEAAPSVWLDRRRSTGEDRTRRSKPPEPIGGSYLGNQNTVDTLDFDYVLDDGVIVTPAGYARIIEIEPTPWLILDEASRESTIQAFERYLAGTGSAIQFLSMPVPFDVEPHRSVLNDCTATTGPEPSVLKTGRDRYGQWLERVVREGEVRDRRHFIVLSVPADTDDRTFSFPGHSAEGAPIDTIEELDARTENARTSLPRTGVEVSVLSDRQSVLEVLYRYYRGDTPPADLDHDWLTRRDAGEANS